MKSTIPILAFAATSVLVSINIQANDITVESLQQQIDVISQKSNSMQAQLESNEKSGFQLAGYASFGWSDIQNGSNNFDVVQFSPIFHYQYSNIFQFEGELEFTVDELGKTKIELEYAAGNLFLNNYMVFVAGRFMSPVGQFVQNIHPAWINKMPSAPLGFGHDGASISSNVGIALRGGLPKVLNTRSNYAIFLANAPVFEQGDDGDTIINTEGRTTSNGASKTIGGRFAINPLSSMEIGISGSTGKIVETLTTGTIANSGNVNEKIQRDYNSFDVDFTYNINSLDIKAEYIRQKVGDNELSNLEAGLWKAYYAQAAYQITSFKLEPVIRYSNYSNPEIKSSQVALALNYLFANNVIAKVAYEINSADNQTAIAEGKDNNRMLAQLAFGF